MDLMNDFYKKFNIYGIPCGNTGAQMGGWFRKEIKSVADLKGLKMRIGGFAGKVLDQARRRAAADRRRRNLSRRWRRARSTRPNGSGPTTTRSSASTRWRRTTTIPAGGKAAPCSTTSSTSRSGKALPKTYQADDRARRRDTPYNWMMAKYDAAQSAGAASACSRQAACSFAPFPQTVMDACFKAANELYARDRRAANADFKKVYDAMVAFRERRSICGGQVAEYSYDSFMIRALRAARRRARRPRDERSPGSQSGRFLRHRAGGGPKSGGGNDSGSGISIWLPGRTGLRLLDPVGHGARPEDQDHHQDHLQHDPGDRAPVDVGALDRRRRDAAQIEQREAERRMHEARLHVGADQHAEPDEVDAELGRDRRQQRNDDEGDLEEIEEERDHEDEEVDEDQEADLPAGQRGRASARSTPCRRRPGTPG